MKMVQEIECVYIIWCYLHTLEGIWIMHGGTIPHK